MSRRAKHHPLILSKKERLAQTYERLVRLRQVDRRTICECAELLQVSERSVNNYLASEEYQQAIERFRSQMREAAITSVADASEKAIRTLIDLMDDPKSGHVRFEAAAKVLDLVGIQPKEDEAKALDDSGEYERLLNILASRPTTINVFQQQVEPGGFLPKALRPDQSGDTDYLPGRMLKQLVSGDDAVGGNE